MFVASSTCYAAPALSTVIGWIGQNPKGDLFWYPTDCHVVKRRPNAIALDDHKGMLHGVGT